MLQGVPSVITGDLSGHIGHQGNLVGFYGDHQVQKFLRRVSFDVEFRNDYRFKIIHIAATDMSFIGAGMNGNPLSPETLTIHGEPDNIGYTTPSGISECSYFIYIYTKSRHFTKFGPASYNFSREKKNNIPFTVIAEQLISETLPVMKPADTGQQALNLMDVYRVSHLPVVKDREYLGLISDKLIEDLNLAEERIEAHVMQLHTPHVHAKQHLFEVASVIYKLNLTVVPIVDEEHNYIGAITLNDVAGKFAQLMSFLEPGGIIILETTWNNYSASQICQIVEGNDARILSLFVSRISQSDNISIMLKLDKVDLSSVIQTFTRYDYQISTVYMDDSTLTDMYEDRLEQFLRYMNI